MMNVFSWHDYVRRNHLKLSNNRAFLLIGNHFIEYESSEKVIMETGKDANLLLDKNHRINLGRLMLTSLFYKVITYLNNPPI